MSKIGAALKAADPVAGAVAVVNTILPALFVSAAISSDEAFRPWISRTRQKSVCFNLGVCIRRNPV